MKNKKSLGQHWLRDRAVLLDIVNLALDEETVAKNTTILEIGPGLGTLTSAIFKFFDKVVAVEYDQELASKLAGQFPGKDLTVFNADFLQFDLNMLPKDYLVIANVPYYITSPIVQRLLTSQNKPKKIVLLVQKEVAERLAVKNGKSSILGLSANLYAKTSLGPIVPRDLFIPPPKVDSQVVVFEVYAEPKLGELDETAFFKVVKTGFSAPRKKLAGNLAGQFGLSKDEIIKKMAELSIDADARPENLSLDDWKKLVLAIIGRR